MTDRFPLPDKYRGEVAMMIVTILWGATFVIVKESIRDISSMLFIAFRFTIAGIIVLPFIIKRKSLLKKDAILAGIFLGVILFIGFATQTIGLKFTTATKSGFITGSSVVMVPFLQIIVSRKIPSAGSFIGVVLVFIGILFLSSGGNSILSFAGDIGKNFNIGDGFTIACAISFAIYIVYLDKLSHQYNFWILLFLQITVSAILAYSAALISSSFEIEKLRIDFTGNLIFGLAYTSIFATLVTTALQTRYQKLITPTKAGIIYSFEPVFAAIIAYFALAESINSLGLVGCSMIFLGLIISETYDILKKSQP
ncbi:MAG: DMT family transporter [bacterium]